MKRSIPTLAALFIALSLSAGPKHSFETSYPSYEGLVMAGYQGWFRADGDGNNVGFGHYGIGPLFDEDHCTIDIWPEVSEYPDTYQTPFVHADGTPARVFSSTDASTTDVHFRWMNEYGLDGVFMQRFFGTAKAGAAGRKNDADKILSQALSAASKYDRAIAVMYDLSGLGAKGEDCSALKEDWKHLVDGLKVTNQPGRKTYLHHNGKPVVAIWGIGFPDRPYDIRKIGLEEVIDFFHNDPEYGGCAVMLGVPAYWRDLGSDCTKDSYLHEIIRKADIVFPWTVQRFTPLLHNEQDRMRDFFTDDVRWCKENGVDYAATVYPGFSWHNLSRREFPWDVKPAGSIPRNGGRFFWQQISTAIGCGARMLYVAMFDEVDEGTAIFKCTDDSPVSKKAEFIGMDGVPSDHYLFLAGEASRALKGEKPISPRMPSSMFSNPVIGGDAADPTLIRIGETYYSSATSGSSEPVYPIFRSTDLVNWEQIGNVFDTFPEWTSGDFWAPEFFVRNSLVYCYYTARRAKDGISCVGVAVAASPEGPFEDKGVIVDWGKEAIDSFVFEDEGTAYITWKAYGLDPRHIELMAAPLSEDGLSLAGEAFTLLVDEVDQGMEGHIIFKKDGYYHILYSALDCCSVRSDYEVRTARSRSFRGPYEFNPSGAILKGDGRIIQSAGHGTAATTPDGRMMYLCHAFYKEDNFFLGRQGVLHELVIGKDGWPAVRTGVDTAPFQTSPLSSKTVQDSVTVLYDDFSSGAPAPWWRHRHYTGDPDYKIRKGILTLEGTGDYQHILSARALSPDYSFSASSVTGKGGLTYSAGRGRQIIFALDGGNLSVMKVAGRESGVVASVKCPYRKVDLKIEVSGVFGLRFLWSRDGKTWNVLAENNAADLVGKGSYRPGLIALGGPVKISSFTIEATRPEPVLQNRRRR